MVIVESSRPARLRPSGARPRGAAELLTSLLARGIAGPQGTEPGIEITPAQSADWPRVEELARRHHLVPQLYAALKRFDPALIGPQLRQKFQSNAARSLQLTSGLFTLLDLFRKEAIPAIPFKGLLLAARAYGGVTLRHAGDLDLLVRRHDIVRAIDVLLASGFRPIYPTATPREERYLASIRGNDRIAYLRSHCEHHLVHDQRQVNVDLHWSFTLREFAVVWDTEAMWRRATTFDLAGHPVPCLSDEDLLLVLCANGAKDGWERLDRVCDVAAVLHRSGGDAIRWPALLDALGRTGMMRILGVGLGLAANLLGASLPDEIVERMSRDTAGSRITAALSGRLLAEPPLSPASRLDRSLLHLRLRERQRDRLRFCLAQLRPSAGDWAALPLPRPLGFLHYLLRPLRLLLRHAL